MLLYKICLGNYQTIKIKAKYNGEVTEKWEGNIMIGVSTYLQDLNLEYLKEAVKLGIKHVFTSVQVIEEDYTNFDEKFEKFLNFSIENNLTLIPDIAPRTFDKLGIKDIGELKDKGFNAVRVDGGFDTLEEMKNLTEMFYVYLNASDIKPEFLKELKEYGCDMSKISVMHNFYPRLYTGLNKEHVVNLNKEFKKHGVRVAAFVQGDEKLRGPVFEGLPTLEKHRGVNPYVATIELKQSYVDDVYIGDNTARISTLEKMVEYNNTGIVTLEVTLDDEFKKLYNIVTPIRRDITDDIIRLAYGRAELSNIKQRNTVKRYAGAITIDNELSGRYEGELNICKKNISSDGKINVIGHVNPEYIDIFNYITRDTTIKFVK